MAVVRARTSPPYALIIFVFLAVIFAGLFVWQLTQQGDLKRKRDEAEEKLSKYVASGETRMADEILAIAPPGMEGKPSAFTAVKRQRDDLIARINGGGKDARAAAMAEVDAAQAIAEANNALSTVRFRAAASATSPASASNLVSAVRSMRAALATADAEANRLSGQLKDNEKTLAEVQNSFKDQIQTLSDGATQAGKKIDELEKQLAAVRAREPDMLKVHDEAMAKAAEKNQGEVRDLQLQIAQLKQDQKLAYEKIKGLTDELAKTRSGSAAGIPDTPSGKIIRTNLTEREVYIGIGRREHVKRGLTFVIFDARSGVKTDPTQDQGKGAIEVVEVGENESRCRITNSIRGQRIVENDVIYNLVFSQQKDRKFRFAVYGEFDVDGDGNATSQERTRIVRMIEDWGGIVVDIPIEELRDINGQPILVEGKPLKGPQIRPQTDFLVIGESPADPRGAKNLDLVSSEQIDELRKKADEYKFVENQAKFSTVTKLNANRFLHLVGYYNTTLVKH